MKVCIFIDGFNLYHALDGNPAYHRYKWLDVSKMAKLFLPSNDELQKVYHFTAYPTWMADKTIRHKLYVQALKSTGVEIVLGAFRRRDLFCHADCKKRFQKWDEKETDVNIAVKLFQSAVRDEYDKAYIISGDSDLIPAIRAVKETFPAKQIGIIIPIGRPAELLKNVADFHMKMKEIHLQTSQFPDPLILSPTTSLSRPLKWGPPILHVIPPAAP